MFKRSFSTTTSTSTPQSLPIFIAHTALRALQFIFALTVLGLYGQTINTARHAHTHPSSKAIYAEVVGALSAITALIFLVPGLSSKSHIAFGWDGVLFILWTAVFGIFGKLYIHKNIASGDGTAHRMKNAVWIDLVNMLLWLVTAVLGVVLFLGKRGGRSLHTGRAKV